jgi:hypothetical protein
VTRSTRPASASWVDGSPCGFMSMIASSVLLLGVPVTRHIKVAGAANVNPVAAASPALVTGGPQRGPAAVASLGVVKVKNPNAPAATRIMEW